MSDQRRSSLRRREAGAPLEFAIRIGALALLLYWAFILVRPFVSVIIWSVVLVIALHPVFEGLARALGGRRRLAALLLTAFNLLVVIGPAIWLALGLIESVLTLADRLDPAALALPPPPATVKDWPLVGERVYDFWQLASTNFSAALAKAAPQLKPLAGGLLRIAADAGTGTLKFFLAVVIAGFLFPGAPKMAAEFRLFAGRLAGERGEEFVSLAGTTIHSISVGVIGVSVLQALLAGLGLVAAGVPGPSLLTSAILIFGIVQLGPGLVIIPVVIWSWTAMDTTTALLFTGYMTVVGLVDNVLKPLVMAHGSQTPMPVILLGLLGGTLAYGITGLFLGPVVLAVFWKLLLAWIETRDTIPASGVDARAAPATTEEAPSALELKRR